LLFYRSEKQCASKHKSEVFRELQSPKLKKERKDRQKEKELEESAEEISGYFQLLKATAFL